MCIKTTFRE